MVDIIIKHAIFSLEKNYPDNTSEPYLFFEMKSLKIENDISLENDLIVLLEIKSVTLYDFDKDENKNFIINKRYQLLIGTEIEIMKDEKGNPVNKEENLAFIDYQFLMTRDGCEQGNYMNINNLHIMASFESLSNIYKFSMYYTQKYWDKMERVEFWKKAELENDNLNKKKFDENKFKENNFANDEKIELNYSNNLSRQDNISKINLKQKKKNNYFKNVENFGKYLEIKFII
jgi:hypothetical protein